MQNQPIGVLDSGVGGLTVLAEIRRQLPHESTIYIGDSRNAPYGKRSPEEIRLLASKLIHFLLSQKAKMIVVACNTITVNGIDTLRQEFPQIPIIGTVPVVKKAAAETKKKKIGLLVTEATAKSAYNQELITKFASECAVTIIGTNKLVPLIESEKYHALPEVIAQELAPFKQNDVDVVVLGSTHFPILRQQIGEFLGKDVALLDSGGAVARQVGRILVANDTSAANTVAVHQVFTTGNVEPFEAIAGRVLESEMKVQQVLV